MVSVVYCTRESKPEHSEHLMKMFGYPKVEILEYVNKGEGLTKYYQKGLDESKYDIVVFLHDDILLETKQVAKKLTKLYEKNPEYGILGVAGTKYLSENGRWWEKRDRMYGRVYHTHEGKKMLSSYSDDLGNRIEEAVTVDGVFFSVHKKRLKKGFNKDVKGFHFYDIDFCFSNYLEGVKVGVHTNIKVNHMSIGETNKEWEDNREIFAEKYKENLPVKIDRTFTGKEIFKVLVSGKSIEELLPLVDKLKQNNFNITVCAPVNDTEERFYRRLAMKNVKFVPISQPPGYKLGDGKWALKSPNGDIPSQTNKLYRVSEINFDVVHTVDYDFNKNLNMLYPDIPCVTTNGDIEEIITEYQKALL